MEEMFRIVPNLIYSYLAGCGERNQPKNITKCFHIPKNDIAWGAMLDYSFGQGDYADHIIARINEMNGAETTLTFDKRGGQFLQRRHGARPCSKRCFRPECFQFGH